MSHRGHEQLHSATITAAVAVSLLATACGHKTPPLTQVEPPPPVVAAAPPPPPTLTTAAPSPQVSAPLTEGEIFAAKTLQELNAEQPLGDAFFDFDQFVIRDDARYHRRVARRGVRKRGRPRFEAGISVGRPR
jgi:hypothetical protein